jgi:hypothetical protein
VSALGPILARTPVAAIDDVLAVQQAIDGALPPTDGVACFNKLYLGVTTNVVAAERQGGVFGDVPFLSALDVAFGNLYFAALGALESGATVPRAWAPLFAARARTDIAPLQFALAGMNAHINRDLPVGLAKTFTVLALPMARPSAAATDFDKVNDVLASTEQQMAATYFTPLSSAPSSIGPSTASRTSSPTSACGRRARRPGSTAPRSGAWAASPAWPATIWTRSTAWSASRAAVC